MERNRILVKLHGWWHLFDNNRDNNYAVVKIFFKLALAAKR